MTMICKTSDWMTVTLGDVTTLQRGFDITKAEQRPGDIPVVSSSGVASYHDQYKVNGPGVVIGRKGSLGTAFYVSGDFWPHDTTLWVKDFHGNDPKFCYYLLKTLRLERFDAGASNPTLNRNHVHGLPVRIPPATIQRRIASILAAYDDLIENNTRRIAILEEMARRIYEEWFIRFRFPGHEQVKMVESELGLIPEGWVATQLGQHLVSLESGKRPKGGVSQIGQGVPSIGAENVISIGRHNFASEKLISKEFFDSMKKGVVADRDVAVYKDGAYIGRSTYFRDSFPHHVCAVNEHVFLLRSSGVRLTQNQLYLWLQRTETIEAIRATNANAAQPGIINPAIK